MMQFQFNPEKAVQAAAVLLRAHPAQQMEYLRLLKLLYIADRESLKQTARPIIGNQPVAMDNGPLHSAVYDLIKGSHASEQVWSAHISKDRCSLQLKSDPGVLELSQQEIEILKQVADQYSNLSEWEIVEVTHKFREWIDNYVEGTSKPIPIEDLLDAVGFSVEEKAALEADLREIQEADKLFA